MKKQVLKNIFKNLIIAIVVMIYFITANILYMQMPFEQMIEIIKICSGIFLISGIVILEIAYKKESGTLTTTAIELLVLSMHALFINHVITIYHFDFRTYLLTSSYIFAIYYVLKSIIIYTKARRNYLKSFSDISEIVKDEPVVKEAKKRVKEENTIEQVEEEKTNISENNKNTGHKKETKKKEIQKKQVKAEEKKKSMTKKTEGKKIENKLSENLPTKKQKKTTSTKQSSKETTIETNEKKKNAKTKNTKKETEENVVISKKIKEELPVEDIKKVQKPKSKRGRRKKEEVEVENDSKKE